MRLYYWEGLEGYDDRFDAVSCYRKIASLRSVFGLYG